MTDPKGVFTPLGQLQVVAAPILFFRQKAVFGQLVQAALGVAPIQMQIFGQFRRRTIRMLSYINDKIKYFDCTVFRSENMKVNRNCPNREMIPL